MVFMLFMFEDTEMLRV